MQGDSGLLTLRIEATLKEVADPVASQIKTLQDIVQPLKVRLYLNFPPDFISQRYGCERDVNVHCNLFPDGVW